MVINWCCCRFGWIMTSASKGQGPSYYQKKYKKIERPRPKEFTKPFPRNVFVPAWVDFPSLFLTSRFSSFTGDEIADLFSRRILHAMQNYFCVNFQTFNFHSCPLVTRHWPTLHFGTWLKLASFRRWDWSPRCLNSCPFKKFIHLNFTFSHVNSSCWYKCNCRCHSSRYGIWFWNYNSALAECSSL